MTGKDPPPAAGAPSSGWRPWPVAAVAAREHEVVDHQRVLAGSEQLRQPHLGRRAVGAERLEHVVLRNRPPGGSPRRAAATASIARRSSISRSSSRSRAALYSADSPGNVRLTPSSPPRSRRCCRRDPEPGDPAVPQPMDPLLVRLQDRILVAVEGHAVGGELVDHLVEVGHVPGGERRRRAAGIRRRHVDVE